MAARYRRSLRSRAEREDCRARVRDRTHRSTTPALPAESPRRARIRWLRIRGTSRPTSRTFAERTTGRRRRSASRTIVLSNACAVTCTTSHRQKPSPPGVSFEQMFEIVGRSDYRSSQRVCRVGPVPVGRADQRQEHGPTTRTGDAPCLESRSRPSRAVRPHRRPDGPAPTGRPRSPGAAVTPLPIASPGDGLTARQRVILDVIRDAVERRGYPPSIREICEAAGLSSTSSVAHQLAALEAKGYLLRDAGRPGP